MCVDVKCLMHILKYKCYVYIGFLFFEGVGDQIHPDVECSIHIFNHKCYIFVGFLKANIGG